jgi:hypothetical protein
VRGRVKGCPNIQDREATTKEWMGRIGDLNLRDFFPLFLLEGGIKMLARSDGFALIGSVESVVYFTTVRISATTLAW